jgi:hypothetical protein
MYRLTVVWFFVLFVGCRQAAAPLPSGPASSAGWEVRYDAVLALAHRGSENFLDPVVQDLVKEMLDADQQRCNFRETMKNGRETVNPQAALMEVLGTINAISDYRTKRQNADLSGIKPALEKLTIGQNQVVAKEARILLNSLKK